MCAISIRLFVYLLSRNENQVINCARLTLNWLTHTLPLLSPALLSCIHFSFLLIRLSIVANWIWYVCECAKNGKLEWGAENVSLYVNCIVFGENHKMNFMLTQILQFAHVATHALPWKAFFSHVIQIHMHINEESPSDDIGLVRERDTAHDYHRKIDVAHMFSNVCYFFLLLLLELLGCQNKRKRRKQ